MTHVILFFSSPLIPNHVLSPPVPSPPSSAASSPPSSAASNPSLDEFYLVLNDTKCLKRLKDQEHPLKFLDLLVFPDLKFLNSSFQINFVLKDKGNEWSGMLGLAEEREREWSGLWDVGTDGGSAERRKREWRESWGVGIGGEKRSVERRE
ncbi:hypothetical protein FCV25MIE_16138 [Fagus crenata]